MEGFFAIPHVHRLLSIMKELDDDNARSPSWQMMWAQWRIAMQMLPDEDRRFFYDNNVEAWEYARSIGFK